MKYAFDDGQDGQYIGAMLKLENGQALSEKGVAQIVLKAEKVNQALFNVAEVNNSWYGFTFAAQLTKDPQIESCAKYAQSNTKLFGVNVIH